MRDEKEKEEYNIHKGFSAELISKKAFLLILVLMLLDHMIYLYQDYQLIYLKDITNEEAYFHTRSINQLNSLGYNLQNFLLYHPKYWKDINSNKLKNSFFLSHSPKTYIFERIFNKTIFGAFLKHKYF